MEVGIRDFERLVSDRVRFGVSGFRDMWQSIRDFLH